MAITPAEGDEIPAHEIHSKHVGGISGTVAGPFDGPCQRLLPPMPPVADDIPSGGAAMWTWTGDAYMTDYGTWGSVLPREPLNCRPGYYAGNDDYIHPIYIPPGSYTVQYVHSHTVSICCDLPPSYYETDATRAETYLDLETVHFNVVAPPPKKRYTDKQKADFTRKSAVLAGDGAAAAAVAAVSVEFPPLAIAAGLLSAGTAGLSAVYSYLAADPASGNYRKAPSVRKVKPPTIAGGGISAPVAKALTALARNYAQEQALGDAHLDAINRSQAAAKAHKPGYEKLQLRAAAVTAGKLASVVAAAPGLRTKLVSALKAAGLPDVPVNGSDVLKTQHEIFAERAPASVTGALNMLGLSTARRTNILSRLQHTPAPAPPSLYELLSDPARARADKKVAADLRSFARKHGGKHRS